MGLFSAGTLLAAVAPGFPVLLAARVVQASGTAIMIPLLMTTVMTLVPPARRGALMGNISIVISVAPAIGPAVSGLVLSVLGWRFLFWLVLPIALVALLVGRPRITNVGEQAVARIDVLSVVLSAPSGSPRSSRASSSCSGWATPCSTCGRSDRARSPPRP
jgi:DHA2 family lincomycin resistance protein-like MFS transporter